MKDYIINDTVSAAEIKNLREMLGMTQKEFASFTNSSLRTIENWEKEGNIIKGPIVTLVEILLRNRDIPEKMHVPKKGKGIRLWYMYENMVCTIIDADEVKRKVKIYNYINLPLYRAFGVNTEPSFEDYEEFLESRCFPQTRDKIKLELKRLDLPFYDPLMIIEKTEGRMAEDHFWIKIER